MELNAQDIITWMHKTNERLQNNKDYLTTLDQAIGDGDHGINMARGFKEVVNKLDNENYETASDALRDTAMTVMSKVGGASGPLYGTAFLKLATSLKGIDPVDESSFKTGLEEALAGVKQRGKSDQGEKTLIDVWIPVMELFDNNFSPEKLTDTAEKAMENTKDMKATKGRASYLGDRSIGHLDPGSVSSFYLFTSLADTVKGGE
ncbi:dihydroxyacetone kinase subunit DhaL [Halobacillus sp. A5]|uniref:dihydroxyacetone kinase subunit DhaL n=1 Tax=Halobacillus sp. A5 TaxID=2880263 RepID=UPI0020A66988|nr:dihydroxyacetone kinase subunit DhaL [Halobacillus sp. A5]MCP3027992.1 dihydroxyacetone kinase subunit L [Halobacillus sp. A5]